MRLIVCLAVVIVIVLTHVRATHEAASTAPAASGKIAFDRTADFGGWRLWTINPDGSELRSLTADLKFASSPDWSPDGARIAFDSEDAIHVMNADGSAEMTMVDEGHSPAWSPDGSRLAFGRYPGMFSINTDGTWEVPFSELPGPRFDSNPDWSPDGSRITFVDSNETYASGLTESEISVMSAEGGGRMRLTNSPGFDGSPKWSPDGSKIAFVSRRDGYGAIYLMNPDGSEQQPLRPAHGCVLPTPDPQPLETPRACPAADTVAWSPDGKQLVFSSYVESGGSDLFIISADGTNERQITFTPDFESFPSWQPVFGTLESTAAVSPTTTPSPTASSADCVEPASPTVAPTLTVTEMPTPPGSHPIFATPTPVNSPPDSVVPTLFVTPSSAYFPTPLVTFPATDSPSPFETPVGSVPAPVATTPPDECESEESAPIGTREQAIALGAMAAIVGGSLIALPAVALRRRLGRRNR